MLKLLRLALALAAISYASASAEAASQVCVPANSGQCYPTMILVDPSTGLPYAASGGSGGGGGGGVYGLTAPGAAPSASGLNPFLNGYLDAGGLVRSASPSQQLPMLTYDTRLTGQSLSATVGSFIDIPLNGAAVVGLNFSGLTASGATITYYSSNVAGQTPTSPISAFNASTGATSGTRTTDGETRIPVAGRTTLRLQVTTGGTGTITVAYNVSAVPGIVDTINAAPTTIQPSPGSTWTNPADISVPATTATPLVTTTNSNKFLSVVNTGAGTCRVGYGGVTPSATRGDQLGAGIQRTFESSFLPVGAVAAFCPAAGSFAVMTGQ